MRCVVVSRINFPVTSAKATGSEFFSNANLLATSQTTTPTSYTFGSASNAVVPSLSLLNSLKEFRRLSDGTTAFDAEPKVYEVGVVVCDVANKFAFEKNSDPVAFAEVTEKLIRETTTHLIDEGAYVHAADGEGVVAFFGFPVPNAEHAQKAARVVLEMLKNFRERRQGKGETTDNWDVRVGIRSGLIIAGTVKDSERPLLLASGEAIDL